MTTKTERKEGQLGNIRRPSTGKTSVWNRNFKTVMSIKRSKIEHTHTHMLNDSIDMKC